MRNYKRLTVDKYEAHEMHEAVYKVNQGLMSLSRASQVYGIPRSTLKFRLKNPDCKRGKPSALGRDEEKTFVEALSKLSKAGFKIDELSLRKLVMGFVDQCHAFRTSRPPGVEWARSFKTRWHSQIDFQHRTNSKTNSNETEKYFFHLLSSAYDRLEVKPQNIYTLEQIQISSTPPFVSLNSRLKPEQKLPQEFCTLLFASNALGESLSPLIVFKNSQMPKTSLFFAFGTESANLDQISFTTWLNEIFLSETREATRLVLFSGSVTVFSDAALKTAENNNVHFVNSRYCNSETLQPLEASVFKLIQDKLLEDTNRHSDLTLNHLLQLIQNIYHECLDNNLISQGFQATGIYPLNIEKIDSIKSMSDLANYAALSSPEQDERINEDVRDGKIEARSRHDGHREWDWLLNLKKCYKCEAGFGGAEMISEWRTCEICTNWCCKICDQESYHDYKCETCLSVERTFEHHIGFA